MRKPFLVLEDIRRPPPRKLFRIGNITWIATRYAWLSPLFWCVLGLAVTWLGGRPVTAGAWLLTGLAYGALLYATNVIHTLGHVVAGWLVHAPMASVVLTSTRDVSTYVRQGATVPRRARLGRAIGGPAFNVLTGGIALALARLLDGQLLFVFGCFNVAVGIWTLLPIPTLDGSVIWASLLRSARDDAA